VIQEYITVGKLVNTHGLKGEVRIWPETDFPEERFKKGKSLYLFAPGQAEPIQLTISSVKPYKNMYNMTFKGIDSIHQVEKWKGGLLKVSKEDRIPLEEGEFYFQDIIGCQVYTQDDEELLGVITEILQPGANDVWVIKRPNGKEALIPYIDDVVKKVDVVEKKVIIYPMPGLL
jgi:16S rRNA processing protein RimM